MSSDCVSMVQRMEQVIRRRTFCVKSYSTLLIIIVFVCVSVLVYLLTVGSESLNSWALNIMASMKVHALNCPRSQPITRPSCYGQYDHHVRNCTAAGSFQVRLFYFDSQ